MAYFWFVIGSSEHFILRAPKCRFGDKDSKNYLETLIQKHVTLFCKIAIVWVEMKLSEHFTGVRASNCRPGDKHSKTT